MLKNKRNNVGFTLIEIIIATSIMSVVIFLGYKIINNINTSVKKQSIITNNQLNINLINKYLTKDLENCSITEFNSNNQLDRDRLNAKLKNEGKYEYKLGNITYIIMKNNNGLYSITRDSIGNKIDIVANQPVENNKLPLYINSNTEGMFNVEVAHIESKNKIYSFSVFTRLTESSTSVETPKPPEVDEELEGKPTEDGVMGNGYIKFEYGQNLTDKNGIKGNIKIESGYVDSSGNPIPLNSAVGTSNLNEFNIYAKISTANNNGKIDVTMQETNSKKIGGNTFVKNDVFGKMEVDTVNLNIINYSQITSLDITSNLKDNTCTKHENENTPYLQGKHSFNINIMSGVHGGEVSAKMRKVGDSGIVILTFGKKVSTS